MALLRGRPDPWPFAVEDRSLQLTWSARGPADAVRRVWTDSSAVEVEAEAGRRAGSVDLTALAAASLVQLRVDDAAGRTWQLPVRTVTPPPGPELFRFATVSDVHVGEDRFGYLGTLREHPEPGTTPPVEPYSTRALRAALGEIAAWGAQLLVVKGDLTESGQAEQWLRFGQLVEASGLDAMVVPGNHDGIERTRPRPGRRWLPNAGQADGPAVDPSEGFALAGMPEAAPVQVRDVPGLRLVLVDTTIAGERAGQIETHRAEVVQALAEAGGPAWVGLHHQLMTAPVPTYSPAGIPASQARRFLDEAVAANPALLVTSGHTHRHRRRHHRGVVVTEVGSPKDFPGTWAGYVVHEGGIRQVVRRVASPDLLAWTDRSARAALHLWGRWAPGRLEDRCFTHDWPRA